MRCTWLWCDRWAAQPHVDECGQFWAALCSTHEAQMAAAHKSGDEKRHSIVSQLAAPPSSTGIEVVPTVEIVQRFDLVRRRDWDRWVWTKRGSAADEVFRWRTRLHLWTWTRRNLVRRPFTVWSCSDFVKHEHRWQWTAGVCGFWQRWTAPPEPEGSEDPDYEV